MSTPASASNFTPTRLNLEPQQQKAPPLGKDHHLFSNWNGYRVTHLRTGDSHRFLFESLTGAQDMATVLKSNSESTPELLINEMKTFKSSDTKDILTFLNSHFNEVSPAYKTLQERKRPALFAVPTLPNKRNKRFTTEDLNEAIATQNLEKVKQILKDQPKILNNHFYLKKNHRSPLTVATTTGNRELVEYLIEKGADPYKTTEKGNSVLHTAAFHGHLDLIEFFVQTYALDLNSPNAEGLTCLHLAIINKQKEAALTFLENGANPKAKTKTGYTPLHVAARYGCVDLIGPLLKHNSVDSRTDKGTTSLHLAVKNGQVDAFKELINNGANFSLTNRYGQTPLDLAPNEDCFYQVLCEYLKK